MSARELLRIAQEGVERFVAELAHLVDRDSGTWEAAGVEEVAHWSAGRLAGLGFDVEVLPLGPVDGGAIGPAVLARRPVRPAGGGAAASGGPRVLLLAHMDTVFPPGTAAARPFRVDGRRALGPGVTDDKAGLLAGLHAVEVLDAAGCPGPGELVVLLTPDEEVGAPGSRSLIEREAAAADVVLCLECARENGDLVAARKGAADVTVTVRGRAAHAGVERERGANAAVAAAHLVVGLEALHGWRRGVGVNVGVVRGGTRPNVVCEEAVVELEVRATTSADLLATLDAVDAAAATASAAVPGTSTDVRRHDVTPPLERTPATEALVAAARAVAQELGFDVAAAATGGVSDANVAAALGTPTLDGLGPVGGGDHGPHEWLDLDSIAPRVALLAGLVARLTAAPPALPHTGPSPLEAS
ncbi:MAG TPA: M20/M25/M40 family metallo-hydrolase [Kineosporiaceae bacterium]|nr:M20/M25/M40 family metallo-hydrolase [Kineosporiaceae bacterium]